MLYIKGTFVNFKRGLNNQYCDTALLSVDGVNTREATASYLGKKVAFVNNGKIVWGKIVKAHGNNGIVRATFRHNLPCNAMGNTVRVMLY